MSASHQSGILRVCNISRRREGLVGCQLPKRYLLQVEVEMSPPCETIRHFYWATGGIQRMLRQALLQEVFRLQMHLRKFLQLKRSVYNREEQKELRFCKYLLSTYYDTDTLLKCINGKKKRFLPLGTYIQCSGITLFDDLVKVSRASQCLFEEGPHCRTIETPLCLMPHTQPTNKPYQV